MNNCKYCAGTMKCRYCSGSGDAAHGNNRSLDNYVACTRCRGTAKCEWCVGSKKEGRLSPRSPRKGKPWRS